MTEVDNIVRKEFVIFTPVLLDTGFSEGWTPGPAPFVLGDITTDSDTRGQYFDQRIQGALYGSKEDPCRWHKIVVNSTSSPGNSRITMAELSVSRIESDPKLGFLAIHGKLEGSDVVGDLSKIARLPPSKDGRREWLEAITGTKCRVGPSARRLYSLAFVTFTSGPESDPFPKPYSHWSQDEKWLWLLASATPFDRYPPPVGLVDEIREQRIELSEDWSAFVLRDGAAFLGRRDDLGESDPFYESASLYFHSIYLDSMLLGAFQRQILVATANELADLDDPILDPSGVHRLERKSTKFRNVYWWTHLSGHGIPNELVSAHNRQHRLSDLANQVFDEIAEYSRQVQTAASDRTNALLGLLTVVALPLGAVVGIFQVIGEQSGKALALAILCAVGIVALIALTLARPLFDPMFRALRGK